MDLKDFVAESLRQIVLGVVEAQSRTDEAGAFINPAEMAAGGHGPKNTESARFASVPGMGLSPWQIHPIEFDVAVTVTETADKKGGLGVVAAIVTVGGTMTSSESSVAVTRLKFSIPLALPHHPGTNPQITEILQKRRQQQRARPGPGPSAAPEQL